MPTYRNSVAVPEEPAHSANWSTLIGKAIDDVSRIAQAEIRLLGIHVSASVEGAIESILPILVAAAIIIGAEACLLTALVLLIHQWLQWWMAFGIAGIVALLAGLAIQGIVAGGSKKILVPDANSSRSAHAN